MLRTRNGAFVWDVPCVRTSFFIGFLPTEQTPTPSSTQQSELMSGLLPRPSACLDGLAKVHLSLPQCNLFGERNHIPMFKVDGIDDGYPSVCNPRLNVCSPLLHTSKPQISMATPSCSLLADLYHPLFCLQH
jgi:hypothetical protein